GDKYNVQVYNLLKLFDAYEQHFVTKKTPHFHLLFHKGEAEVMGKYCSRLLEESWEKLTKKYKFSPDTPVFSEMFSLHADFAVRTMGFPGLGALGACFGPLITLDSPKARNMGAFNWASTTWHEFAHVVSVQQSKGRVPRWFTEGLAVYEERCGRPYWFRQAHRLLLGRLKAGGLTPIKELNAQFTGGNVLLAYFHSSWVVEFIVDTYGFQAIIDMLEAYGRDLKEEHVFAEVLKETPDGLDTKFKAWLAERFAHVQVTAIYTEKERKKLRLEVEKSPSDPAVRVKYARACLQNGKLADAEINAGRVRKHDPANGDASNLLGEIFFLKERYDASKKYFHEALARGVSDYNTWLRLAALAEKAGEVEKATKFFETARDAFPVYGGPDSPYRSLRVLYGRQGREGDALKALESLVALLESEIPLRLELAGIYRLKGRAEGEKRILREVHEIWPFRIKPDVFPEGYFNTHLRLGELLAAGKAWEEALFEAEVALLEAMFGVQETPKKEEVEIRVFLAECLAAVGRVEDAKTQLEEVVEFMDPANEKAKKLLEKLQREGK
ncbi:MAG: tetratricopeptide repeat protein, partial [Planctomycetota bacterium]